MLAFIGGMGFFEMLVVGFVAVLFAVLFVWPAWRVCSKAGFPGALSLIVVVPGGIIVLLFVLALVPWPALQGMPGAR